LEKIETVKVEKVVEGIPINADLALG
jgi:hypothetical protein